MACGSRSTSATRWPSAGEVGRQADGGGGLADPAFLVDEGIDASHGRSTTSRLRAIASRVGMPASPSPSTEAVASNVAARPRFEWITCLGQACKEAGGKYVPRAGRVAQDGPRCRHVAHVAVPVHARAARILCHGGDRAGLDKLGDEDVRRRRRPRPRTHTPRRRAGPRGVPATGRAAARGRPRPRRAASLGGSRRPAIAGSTPMRARSTSSATGARCTMRDERHSSGTAAEVRRIADMVDDLLTDRSVIAVLECRGVFGRKPKEAQGRQLAQGDTRRHTR